MSQFCVCVASHKQYPVSRDPLYIPMRVGAYRDQDTWVLPDGRTWLRDDASPDNISHKNASWCELTAVFAMRNLPEAEIYGLCHYRRYFRGNRGKGLDAVLTQVQAEQLMNDADVLLPRPRHYVLQTSEQQYAHAHHMQDLVITEKVLAALADPRYVEAYRKSQQRRSGHRFNMFLMRRPVFLAYTDWLFSVLEQVETQLDTTGYSAQDLRVFGYLSERLLDVWLTVNPQRVKECSVIHLEGQCWPKKIMAFLGRMIKPAR